MSLDGSTVYLILVFAAVSPACQAAIGLFGPAQQRRKVTRRLTLAERTGGGIAELVIELRKQRGLTASGDATGGIAWLSALIVRSGVPYDPRRWTLAVIAVAFVGG